MAPLKTLLASTILGSAMFTAFPTLSFAIGFNFEWTGSNNYTMTGMFSFDDSLDNTGPIDESDLNSFMFEGFLSNVSIGAFTADTSAADFGQTGSPHAFQFNYDTTSNSFLLGGGVGSSMLQLWNFQPVTGIGWGAGTLRAIFSLQNSADSLLSARDNPNTIVVTQKPTPTIPEPSTYLLFGSGLLGLAGYRWQQRRRERTQIV